MRKAFLSAGLAAVLLTSATGTAPGATLVFRDACRAGDRLNIAAVGDLLFHKKLLLQAFRKGGSFQKFWAPVADILANADLAYGNLEGPAAHGVAPGGRVVKDPGRRYDGRVYGYKLPVLSFNYPPFVIDDIKAAGFDVISLANNHALDRGSVGVDRTVDNFVSRGVLFSGVRKRKETAEMRPWSVITPAKGFRVAWLACTFSTNGLPDRHAQVLRCYKQKEDLLAEVKRLADDPKVDAVIVTPHWGVENYHYPQPRQRALAREIIDAGAVAVLGSHPHVLQPWEKHVTASGREGLIVFSLGNFVSNQRRLMQRAGAIATIELTRAAGGKAEITAAGFVPTWVVIDGRGHRAIENVKGITLRKTLGLLPKGNRVRAKSPFKYAKACGPNAVADGADSYRPQRGITSPPRVRRVVGKKKRGWGVRSGKKRRAWKRSAFAR